MVYTLSEEMEIASNLLDRFEAVLKVSSHQRAQDDKLEALQQELIECKKKLAEYEAKEKRETKEKREMTKEIAKANFYKEIQSVLRSHRGLTDVIYIQIQLIASNGDLKALHDYIEHIHPGPCQTVPNSRGELFAVIEKYSGKSYPYV